jgi:hypothetical protein
MCCALTDRGRDLIAEHRSAVLAAGAEKREPPPRLAGVRALAQVRHEVHVAGWSLALERVLGVRCALYGAAESMISPPSHSTASLRVTLGPADLRLPTGRVVHDFLHTTADGERVDAERFETLRPDATVNARDVDVLVERDDRLPPHGAVAKLERYDHFLSGWSLHTRRYGRRREALALVVFVCRDRARARELARRSDAVLCACRAYAGEYPFDWEYPGRERIVFAAERDVHEGSQAAYCVPRLPPSARVLAAHGDPSAGEAAAEACEILPAAQLG